MYQPIGGGGNSIIENYLTIVALEDGLTAKLSVNACEYCVDGDGNWKSLSAATNTEMINTGQTLSFRGNLTPISSGVSSGIGTFTISKSCNLEGNCMSMLFGDNAASNKSLSGKDYAFYKLFKDCATIKSVSSGFLLATTLASSCYYSMFHGCTSLTTTPELPATTLSQSCYASMFYGCTSLTTTPELPATTLAIHCYNTMFFGCSNITQSPSILPATTLEEKCYYGMFQYCSNLTQAPELPATTLVRHCYLYMFQGCTKLNYIKAMFITTPSTTYTDNWLNGVASTGTFVKNKNATWNVTGSRGIPSGWTVQTA